MQGVQSQQELLPGAQAKVAVPRLPTMPAARCYGFTLSNLFLSSWSLKQYIEYASKIHAAADEAAAAARTTADAFSFAAAGHHLLWHSQHSSQGGTPVTLETSEDTQEFKHFLRTTVVAVSSDIGFRPPRPQPSSEKRLQFTMGQTVNDTIQYLMDIQGRNPKNILARGYTIADQYKQNIVMGTQNVHNFYPNTIVNTLKNKKEWNTLLSRIGTDSMLHLLLYTSIFVSLPNRCYYQVSGMPLGDIKMTVPSAEKKRKPRPDTVSECQPNQKRRKTDDKQCIVFLNASDIQIPRVIMFYKRPVRTDSGDVAFGLPVRHALKEFRHPHQTRDLLKIIFPRQFNIPSAFDLVKEKTPPPWITIKKNTTTNERKEIRKIPPRLAPAEILVARMMILKKRCNVKEILNCYCPQKIKENLPAAVADESGMLGFAANYHQVFSFLKSVLKKLIPKEFWGSAENEKAFMKALECMISLRRFDTWTLHVFLRGFKISACKWLVPQKYFIVAPKHVPPTDMMKRKQILEDFIYWVVEDVVLGLLKTCFYITESAPCRHKMFYFRHDDWARLTAPTICKLGTVTYARISKMRARRCMLRTKLSHGLVRLVPKESGTRPILNLRTRILANNKPDDGVKLLSSVNSALQNVFHVLKLEHVREKSLKGASVFSLTDIYEKVKQFKSVLTADKKLYFVKVDVVKCFDTIEQSKLIEMLDHILSEPEYIIKKYTVIDKNKGILQRRFNKKALPIKNFAQFPDLAKTLAGEQRRSVFSDGVLYQCEERSSLMKLLRNHISNTVVKMGRKFYRQVNGIPQGSVLSSILCSFFYAHMESAYLSDFQTASDLLMRLVDDFLYVTTDLDKALRFVTRMHQGFPEYGCSVNPLKSLVNFEVSVEADGTSLKRVNDNSGFPWCGMLICTKTFNFRPDFSKLLASNVADSLVVNGCKQPWRQLSTKIIHFFKPKSHAIFFDTSLNSLECVLVNVYESYAICAIKTMFHVGELLSILGQQPRRDFITKTVLGALSTTFLIMSGRVKRKNGVTGCTFSVRKWDAEWLALRAFVDVFSKSSGKSRGILLSARDDLRKEMLSRRLRGTARKLLIVLSNNTRRQQLLNSIHSGAKPSFIHS